MSNLKILVENLYSHSEKKYDDVDLEAFKVTLEMGQQYGMSAYYNEQINVYMITRNDKDIWECDNFLNMMDITLAIIYFCDVGIAEETDNV